MTPNLLASFEQLENYGPFHDFCDKLDSDWTETVKSKLAKGEKMTSEDYARAKIYSSLKEMPKKLRFVLTPKVRKEEQPIYQE